MASTPEFNSEQLAAVRAARWHQNGEALLTLEAAREWISELGLVLFAPRAHQLPTPAPSFVEATLGRAAEAPTAAETEAARGLVARMVADGSALPLNLLGGPGDVPDFVASAQAFSFVFTLRGDKAWKQPPATSGSVKVSPLAAKVYGVLAERGALTGAELVSELGRELTENAVFRALSELWTQLRALPIGQKDGSATLWELTSRRFTRAIKAGANAGQPTALSALISLYLTQNYAASEDEIETFLSPLAARSRVRDALHGLTAARQLEPAVLNGKTLLYIPGTLPEFPEAKAPEPSEAAETEEHAPAAEGRIRSFAGRGRQQGALRGRPERRPPAREGGLRPPRRMADRSEERHPRADREQGADQQSFTRPWSEERRPKRPAAEDRGERPRFKRGDDRGERPRFKREGGGKPPFDRERRQGQRPDGGAGEHKPFKPRKFEGERKGGERKPFRPRQFEGESRPGERKPFRPRKFEGEREGKRPGGFGPRGPRSDRPAPRGKRPFDRSAESAEGPQRRPFRPRSGAEDRGGAPARRFERGTNAGRAGANRGYTPRGGEQGGRPAPNRPFRRRAEGGAPAKKGFGGKRFGEGARPKFGGKPGKFGGRSGGPGPKRGGGPRGKRPRGPEAEE